MISDAYRIQKLNIEEYLAGERVADLRHEYVDGELFAMVGASRAHNLLSVNLVAALKGLLVGSSCRITASDMKVRIPAIRRFYYPDIMVSCNDVGEEPDDYFETQPQLIVEILSSSTESVDRREKRLAYMTIESLQHYVLVSQQEARVECYQRDGDGWSCTTLDSNDTLTLSLPDELALPVAAIYEGVSLSS